MEGKIILLVTHDILLSIVLSDNILGLSENGEKQFFLPKEICLNERRLDDLFNVSFKVFRDEEENIQALSVNMIGENIGGEGA
jgi:ABC-type cobalamin/Fe3+-siderophores transport system ATPase subunit